jgi:hypothetical protein
MGARRNCISRKRCRIFVGLATASRAVTRRAQRVAANREAESINFKLENLRIEIYNRQLALTKAISTIESIDDLRKLLGSLPFTYAEFKSRTLYELVRELRTYNARADETLVNKAISDFMKREPSKLTLPNKWAEIGAIRFGILDDLDDSDVPNIKAFYPQVFTLTQNTFFIRNGYMLNPKCSPGTVLQSVLGGSPEILVAHEFF